MLQLPDHVFPIAGLGVGYPADDTATINPRLPLEKAVHHNRFRDVTKDEIDAYDAKRAQTGQAKPNWSEAKARSYAKPHRTDFGSFIRAIGFKLD